MSAIVLLAIGLSMLAYLSIGLRINRQTRVLGDQLPFGRDYLAQVNNRSEFSAATVATTISLATVVLAYFELAGYFGSFLLWTVVTTGLGLVVLRLSAHAIWKRMAAYDYRPTLHEFLATEFSSPSAGYIGAACTSLGFLGAFAVELTVGSRFLAQLVPSLRPLFAVLALGTVAFAYTAAGGFRAVIETDTLQMRVIWCLLLSLAVYYAWTVFRIGIDVALSTIPRSIYDFSARDGLWSFLIGIFIINVPTFVSDMGVWQRIAGSPSESIVTGGLGRSVIGTTATWTLLAVFACLASVVATPQEGQNPLAAILLSMEHSGFLGAVLLFISVAGLYAAMLSVASTQLIASTHTIYEDIISGHKKQSVSARVESLKELRLSRVILLGVAIAAVVVVEFLTAVGFSVADLVFAVYGAQLGLFPAVALALFRPRSVLRHLAPWAAASIGVGFLSGWTAAVYGKLSGNGDVVFLAPAVSLGAAAVVLGLGLAVNPTSWKSRA